VPPPPGLSMEPPLPVLLVRELRQQSAITAAAAAAAAADARDDRSGRSYVHGTYVQDNIIFITVHSVSRPLRAIRATRYFSKWTWS